jgi:hypothetical protein
MCVAKSKDDSSCIVHFIGYQTIMITYTTLKEHLYWFTIINLNLYLAFTHYVFFLMFH